jgi:hypothetical protein
VLAMSLTQQPVCPLGKTHHRTDTRATGSTLCAVLEVLNNGLVILPNNTCLSVLPPWCVLLCRSQRGSCPRGEACYMTHGLFEFYANPGKYKTKMCKAGRSCKRHYCFFRCTLCMGGAADFAHLQRVRLCNAHTPFPLYEACPV